jgi:hypothetical protein
MAAIAGSFLKPRYSESESLAVGSFPYGRELIAARPISHHRRSSANRWRGCKGIYLAKVTRVETTVVQTDQLALQSYSGAWPC